MFSRGRALKDIEEGLRWKASGTAQLPGRCAAAPDCVFVEVPAFRDMEQAGRFVEALANESRHMLGSARPARVYLIGDGACGLPIDGLRAVAQAACPDACGVGLDINPAALEPGFIAGCRSVGVDRFNFLVDGPFNGIDEPVRRARALGAFASIEVRFGGELAGRAFLQAVERAVHAAPNEISVCDGRSHGAFGAEYLERAGALCTAAGYRRVSIWAWAQGDHAFDRLGRMIGGFGVALGPGAVNFCPAAYRNPGLARWLETRLAGDFEALRAQGRQENWLALAAGLYHMELRRDRLDVRMHRHFSALQRMGVVDRKGKPSFGRPIELCHRAARAARLLVLAAPMEAEPSGNEAGEELSTQRIRG